MIRIISERNVFTLQLYNERFSVLVWLDTPKGLCEAEEV